MGTTSDKLTYLNETKTQLKNMLNYGGANITNEPFRQYVSKLFQTYIESLNNPLTLWNNLPKSTNSGTSITINNTIEAPIKLDLIGNTSQTGTPTPTSPIPINVVSGDNEIVICGKNLANPNNLYIGQTINGTTGELLPNQAKRTAFLKNNILPSTGYTFSVSSAYRIGNIFYYDKNKTLLSSEGGSWEISKTFTTPNNAYYVSTALKRNDDADMTQSDLEALHLQLELETATIYEPYIGNTYTIKLGDIELCKIQDYIDRFIRGEDRNLFDKDNATIKEGYAKDDNGNEAENASGNYTTSYTPVEPNTTYTFSYKLSSAVARIYFYDKDKNWISRTGNFIDSSNKYTFTTPSSCYYLQFQNVINFISGETQLQKGNQVLPYEPYNSKGKWYLRKEIGKVVLNGSEDWSVGQYGTNSYYTSLTNYLKPTDSSPNQNISNIFKGVAYSVRAISGNNIVYVDLTLGLYIRNTSYTSLADFQTMLGAINMIYYYVLNEPTTEEVTNTILKNQLEEIYKAKSKENQTNINQINNDLPFNITATTINDLG